MEIEGRRPDSQWLSAGRRVWCEVREQARARVKAMNRKPLGLKWGCDCSALSVEASVNSLNIKGREAEGARENT